MNKKRNRHTGIINAFKASILREKQGATSVKLTGGRVHKRVEIGRKSWKDLEGKMHFYSTFINVRVQ